MENNAFVLKAAVYLVLIQKDEILLLRRYNTGWQDGNYSLIAGHLDGNETAMQAMSREAYEEAGISIEEKDLTVVHTMHRKSDDYEYIDLFLVPSSWKGEPQIMEQNKADELKWYTLDKLPENIVPHVKYALSAIENGSTYSEFAFE